MRRKSYGWWRRNWYIIAWLATVVMAYVVIVCMIQWGAKF